MFKISIYISQETHDVSMTKTNKLMPIGDIITVYLENHTKYKYYTLWTEFILWNLLSLKVKGKVVPVLN
jgi:hypothetical protein